MQELKSTTDQILFEHLPIQPKRVLVVGSKIYDKKPIDRRKLYNDAIGVDMSPGEGVDLIHDMENPLPDSIGKFDHVDCVSVLEHCARPWLMAETIQNAMKPGATLFLSAPFCWRVHGYPSDYYRYTIEAFSVLFPNIKWKTRGYLTNSKLRKISNRVEINNRKYIERCEAVGFGLLVSK